jgi:hypothetical protein
MKPIKYEPHPVSPERKAELIAAGFKIVDARFAPLGDVVATGADAPQPMPAPTARRGRPPRNVKG